MTNGKFIKGHIRLVSIVVNVFNTWWCKVQPQVQVNPDVKLIEFVYSWTYYFRDYPRIKFNLLNMKHVC